jgi:diamine N-acetyltransferase
MTESTETTVTAEAKVTLREITGETVDQILAFKVTSDQDRFVAPNAVSIAEAYFEPKAWFRAIYAGETPVGFVMLYQDADEPVYYLWRYMIDARYQGMGFGRHALQQVIEYVRTQPRATELLLSYVPDEHGPEKFYSKLGFINTGKMHDDELEMKLQL